MAKTKKLSLEERFDALVREVQAKTGVTFSREVVHGETEPQAEPADGEA